MSGSGFHFVAKLDDGEYFFFYFLLLELLAGSASAACKNVEISRRKEAGFLLTGSYGDTCRVYTAKPLIL